MSEREYETDILCQPMNKEDLKRYLEACSMIIDDVRAHVRRRMSHSEFVEWHAAEQQRHCDEIRKEDERRVKNKVKNKVNDALNDGKPGK